MKIIAFFVSLLLFVGVTFAVTRFVGLPFPSSPPNQIELEQADSKPSGLSAKSKEQKSFAEGLSKIQKLPLGQTSPSTKNLKQAQVSQPTQKSPLTQATQETQITQPMQITQPSQTFSETSKPELANTPSADKAPAPEVIAPPPLKLVFGEDLNSVLSVAGVVSLTNQHRAAAGLPLLALNPTLIRMADVKAIDMKDKEYFAHVSPSGVGVSSLANSVGYAYLLVGENLALGNFKNDAALVTGWMNSPGHRANILKPQFTEIGVAVIEGTHEGQRVWYAVQEFGLPRSACPFPDENLKEELSIKEVAVNGAFNALSAKQQALEELAQSDVLEYNRQVPLYNELVNSYNVLVSGVKKMVDQYNQQVQALNECMQSRT